jgi:cytochrome P450
VQALIAASDPASGRALSDDEIRDGLIVFMLAGHDTTATTLTYALWALGRHRDMQDKVRAEAVAIGDRELTPENVAALGYTVQVLHEALRLCPPAATTSRMAMRDIEVDGYRVEAGTMLAVGIYALHRDPALWDHPLVFDPDRFSPENSAGRDRWQYLPFGAGPRSCIGDHFAMLEATLALATIIRRTEIQSIDADFPIIVPFTTVAAAPIRAQVNDSSQA